MTKILFKKRKKCRIHFLTWDELVGHPKEADRTRQTIATTVEYCPWVGYSVGLAHAFQIYCIVHYLVILITSYFIIITKLKCWWKNLCCRCFEKIRFNYIKRICLYIDVWSTWKSCCKNVLSVKTVSTCIQLLCGFYGYIWLVLHLADVGLLDDVVISLTLVYIWLTLVLQLFDVG